MTQLKKDDAKFLLKWLTMPETTREKLRQGTPLNAEETDHLRDLCGERLQTHGFGPSYEPTAEGKRLEELVDRLYIG